MKKTLLCFMIMCMIVSCVNVYATENEDTVLYEQDFENYSGGRFEALNAVLANGSWTAMPSDKYLEKGEVGENAYLKLVNDNDTAAINMTFTFKEKISDGIVVFNYDLAHSGKVNNAPRIRLHDDSNTERLALFINADSSIKKVCGPKPDFKSNASFSGTNVQYKDIEAEKPISVMQILNFDEDYFETYIDGELLDRVETLPFSNIISWGLYGFNTVSYFDNLSIKTLGEIDFGVKVTGEMGGDGLEIIVPDTVNEEITAEKIIVTDRNENTVIIKEVSTENHKVTVKFENPLAYDEKYTVALNVKDKYGRGFDDKSIMSKSEVDENGNVILRVKNITAITAEGDELEISEKLTPEISKFKIEFNTFVGEIGNGIKLNGKALNGNIDEKTVTAEIDGLLIGDTDYILTVDENVKTQDETSAKPYTAEFSTEKGRLNIKEFVWEKENGEKATEQDVTSGKKLKLMLKVANTTEVSENMYLSYSVFSGNAQKSVMFKPVLNESGKYNEFYLEYTVAENNEDIRGIVFNNFTSLTPTADCAVID